MADPKTDLNYRSIRRDGNFEIREYAPQTLAEILILGGRKEAILKGFRHLFDYISGQNASRQKIQMTAPVLQERTTIQNEWKIRFIMPSYMTFDEACRPNNTEIHLVNAPKHSVAVIGFSGFAGVASLARHEKHLNSWLEKNNVVSIGNPIYAFYNPPWTLPFFRRNEIIKKVKTV